MLKIIIYRFSIKKQLIISIINRRAMTQCATAPLSPILYYNRFITSSIDAILQTFFAKSMADSIDMRLI